ncbi:hypothetical protein O181_069733 [Austropuccinia psidii MF-1]|uniref:Endonuclease/exonuclease/phosphatase domain-containing protein n=1 Tax=Austropuccinia psidii MF-1 TaxID=1389203 RepID=A0A9Q3I6M3_9BASI|nr:hypothetical protein [Austropuccinia psidii MF-1]
MSFSPAQGEMDMDVFTVNANDTDDYSKRMFEMLSNMSNRLNSLEKNIENIKKNKKKVIEKENNNKVPATPPANQQNMINQVIAENKELRRKIHELENKASEGAKDQNPLPQVNKVINDHITTTRIPNPLPAPPNKTINLFKRGNVLIRANNEKDKPFQQENAEKIANKLIKALESINATVNGTPIEIKSFIRYTSGDVRLFTKGRAQAIWLLDNRPLWTHIADPLFTTTQALFPILVHSVPVHFDIDDDPSIEFFCEENDIPREKLKKIRWIGHPEDQKKIHGSFIMYMTDKELAGIDILENSLQHCNTREFPFIIAMDAYLHHQLWNPKGYNHVHRRAKDLITICGKKGFKLISPKGTPTYIGRNRTATTIDLTWSNLPATKIIGSCEVQSGNHASDHQPIITTLNITRENLKIKELHTSMAFESLDRDKFFNGAKLKLDTPLRCSQDVSTSAIDSDANNISDISCSEYLAQVEAIECYQEWQLTFKKKVEEFKRKQWRSFLVSEGINHTFHAFKFTKQKASCDVAPLKKSDGRLTTDKKEKTELLFNMFAQAGEPINLANIQHESPLPPFSFREITTHEIMNNIK